VDDRVIRGGEVLDGTGSDAVRGDVAIRDGGIASITPRYTGTAQDPLGLHAAVKMTGGPARALGLIDRGLLREGYRADVTMFDPATIIDQATFEEPHQDPVGISTTIVNGVVVLGAGRHTGALPGRVPRRGPAGVA
jgi:N-acyl-D-amino-acid deacylase